MQALSHFVRNAILGLLHERAATVSELAAALERVVRTRRVRAIDERFYGRTARHFYVDRQPCPHLRGAGVGFLGADGRARGEFDRLPRSGDTVYGFALGVYPTDQPTLPGGDD